MNSGLRIGIGLGLGPDSERAALDAASQAKKAVPSPDLAIAFGSIHLDQKAVHAALCKVLRPEILAGVSSYAEITNAGVTKGSVAVLLLSGGGVKADFADADAGQDAAATGRLLADRLAPATPGRRSLGLLFTGLGSGYENATLAELSSRLGGIPFFGGKASSDYDLGLSHPDFWTAWSYCGGRLAPDSARLARLDLPAGITPAFGFGHGWDSVGPVVTLSRCQGPEVFEVDGMPVFDFYRQFLGDEGTDEFFEKMVQRFGLSLLSASGGEDDSILKVPVCCDRAKGSITFHPAEDLQGRKARLLQSRRQGLLQGAREAAQRCRSALGGAQPRLVLMVSCCTRSAILHSRMDDEVSAVRSAFGQDVPIMGYYSGGEIAPMLSRYEAIVDPANARQGSCYHATTVTLLAFGAQEAPEAVVVPSKSSKPEDPAAEVVRLRGLLAAGEAILDGTEGFLANMNRKSYRDGERIRRQNELIHRYTPHQVWDQVGAAAARGDDEVHDSEFNGTFLFMDVKGFTTFSEIHGSGEVVAALNELFAPATEIVYACGGDVDKYIGDCIFAAFPGAREALEAGRRILVLFRGLNAKGNPFTVRVGINAGRAVRANVGSKGRREYTFIGDAVNVAQRLESNAAPGSMLVSEEVFRQAGASFTRTTVRKVAVKGRHEPVSAVECVP